MTVDASAYLAMERAVYAELVARSKFGDESFTSDDRAELVVGSYAQQERFDYERWLLGGLTIGPDAVALEYGCGPGRMLLRLSPLFQRIDGIDISPEVLEVARRRTQHLKTPPVLMLTDGQSVPAESERYDLAYSVICLQHICVYDVRRRILEGLFRALKPGGVLTFQLGYGPGHAARVDYFTNYVTAKNTNGAVDVTVLHPAEVAIDLCDIGFVSPSFALTPTGPGDTHGAWIFVRAIRPGLAASVAYSARDWQEAGFEPAAPDLADMQRARHLQNRRGLMKRSRDEASTIETLRGRLAERERTATVERAELAAKIADLERQLAVQTQTVAALDNVRRTLEDSLALRDMERTVDAARIAALKDEREQLLRRVERDERQLRRVRVGDRRRVRALMDDLVNEADERELTVGVLGCGEFAAWLFDDTALANLRCVRLFDSDPARFGSTLRGHVVAPANDLTAAGLDVVIVASLAFQDEMKEFLKALPLGGTRIVTCYP